MKTWTGIDDSRSDGYNSHLKLVIVHHVISTSVIGTVILTIKLLQS